MSVAVKSGATSPFLIDAPWDTAGAREIVGVDSRGAVYDGRDGLNAWKQWFADRIEDLVAALATATSDIFVQQMKWAQSMQVARGLSPDAFQVALVTLQTALASKLPTEAHAPVEAYVRAALDA